MLGASARFHITRQSDRPHVSFGAGGPHQCLGEQLGMRELRTFFRRFLERVEDFEVHREIGIIPNPRFNMVTTWSVPSRQSSEPFAARPGQDRAAQRRHRVERDGVQARAGGSGLDVSARLARARNAELDGSGGLSAR
jgi:hypothetical protein